MPDTLYSRLHLDSSLEANTPGRGPNPSALPVDLRGGIQPLGLVLDSRKEQSRKNVELQHFYTTCNLYMLR